MWPHLWALLTPQATWAIGSDGDQVASSAHRLFDNHGDCHFFSSKLLWDVNEIQNLWEVQLCKDFISFICVIFWTYNNRSCIWRTQLNSGHWVGLGIVSSNHRLLTIIILVILSFRCAMRSQQRSRSYKKSNHVKTIK